jgi:hypothetical protein
MSFWNEFFFLIVIFLSSELNSYYLMLHQDFHYAKFSIFVCFCAEFSIASKFFIAFYCCVEFLIALNFLPLICFPHKVSFC